MSWYNSLNQIKILLLFWTISYKNQMIQTTKHTLKMQFFLASPNM
jgi:hypothetical protein